MGKSAKSQAAPGLLPWLALAFLIMVLDQLSQAGGLVF
jgi:hypothetical protein